jgi:hypothetical protein
MNRGRYLVLDPELLLLRREGHLALGLGLGHLEGEGLPLKGVL